MVKIAIALFSLVAFTITAHARAHHYRHHHHYRTHSDEGPHYAGSYGPRPRAWCGWYARQLVGADPGPAFNLARNWAHWGSATSAHIGAIVVWAHHVGKIVGGAPGHWAVLSGNFGHAVRTAVVSTAGAIAFRD